MSALTCDGENWEAWSIDRASAIVYTILAACDFNYLVEVAVCLRICNVKGLEALTKNRRLSSLNPLRVSAIHIETRFNFQQKSEKGRVRLIHRSDPL